MEKEVIIIAALSKNGVIGKGNTLPWRLPADMAFFAAQTTGYDVIMGRKTWDSIPAKFKPLPNRRNIVLTKATIHTIQGADVFDDLQVAIDSCTSGKVFISGGYEIYKMALPLATKLMLTRVNAEIDGDVKFPDVNLANYTVTSIEEHLADEKHKYPFDFVTYEK